MQPRPCGECTACCRGYLSGNAYGNMFKHARPCVFLQQHKCTIYQSKPEFCSKYQCAWSQHVLPEHMQPDACGLLISVRNTGQGQHLEVIPMRSDVSWETWQELDQVVKNLGTTWQLVEITPDCKSTTLTVK